MADTYVQSLTLKDVYQIIRFKSLLLQTNATM